MMLKIFKNHINESFLIKKTYFKNFYRFLKSSSLNELREFSFISCIRNIASKHLLKVQIYEVSHNYNFSFITETTESKSIDALSTESIVKTCCYQVGLNLRNEIKIIL